MIAFADVITSLSVASGNDSLRHGSKGAGFAAIWSMFMVIAISIYAYYALTKVGRCLTTYKYIKLLKFI